MIQENVRSALNEQIREELNSAYIYLAMAADFQAKNLAGFASWMQIQSREEVGHAMKLFGFITERGGRVELKKIDTPTTEWSSPLAAFKDAYDHERYITGTIERLVKLAREEHDYATESFLNWFIDEQVEEEAAADMVVKKLEMVGNAPSVIYLLDKELGKRGAE